MEGIERALLRSFLWSPIAKRIVVPTLLGGPALDAEADVLQVGCGAGFETAAIASRRPGWRILAIDIDQEMVGLAKTRISTPNVRFEEDDATRLDLPASTFDIVLSALVWHHLPNWQAATAEAGRVLKPDGTLVLLDLVPLSAFARPPISFALGYSYEELLRAISDAGFRQYWGRRFAGLAYHLQARRTLPARPDDLEQPRLEGRRFR